MGKIIMTRKFLWLKIDGSGLFEVYSLYRYGQTQKKQERPQPEKDGNELDHNHQHLKCKSKSLKRLIHKVKFLTCVWGAQFKSWPGHGLPAMTSFSCFPQPLWTKVLRSKRTVNWVTTASFHKLSQSLFTNHPTNHMLWQSEKFITIHKLRKPKTLSFISCKRRHYSRCSYVAIFLNNNSIGYMNKLKLIERISWVHFSKTFVNRALNHAF